MIIPIAPVAGPAESTSQDHADCGTLAGNAWTRAYIPSAPSLPTIDNATNQQLADAINALEIPGLSAIAEQPTDIVAYCSTYIGQCALIVGVEVDGSTCYPDPNGSAAHWLDPYSISDSNVTCYNVWYASYETYSTALFQSAYLHDVGTVRIIYNPVPEDEMTNIALNFKGEVHTFTLRNGTLHHNWPGTSVQDSETITGTNNELGQTVLRTVTGVVDKSGTANLVVGDGNNNWWIAYQGPTESVWHIQGLP